MEVTASRTAARMRSQAGQRQARSRNRFLIASLLIVAAIGYMIYSATQSGSEYYLTAGEILAKGDEMVGQPVKMGGRVVDNSIQWDRTANTVAFALTDGTQDLPVMYSGIVPDTFQSGADVILEGKLGADGQFQATTMLAKCASKYEPAIN
jgi:cytochrome c-type biogenesis protein CcmE